MKKLNIKYESIEWTIQEIIDSEDSIEWDIFCKHFKAGIENTTASDISLYYFDFFYLFEERINWSSFCENKNIHWSHFSRSIFPHQITNQYRQNYKFTDKNKSQKKAKLISLQLTKKINLFSLYYNKLDWSAMSSNEYIPLEIWLFIFNDFKYRDVIPKLNFKKLSSLKNIPWDLTLHYGIEINSVLDYSEQWDWEEIVNNKSIKWNRKMIIDHAKHFPWNGKSGGSTGKYWYIPSILVYCSHINFPSEVLKEYTNNWVVGMFDGCERTDSEGDWIIFSRNHNINYEILKEFGSKLDIYEVIKKKNDWTLKELKLMKNIIFEKQLYFLEDDVFKKLVCNKNVQELILIETLKKL